VCDDLGIYILKDVVSDLIDKDGVVRKVWDNVRPEEHADEVLQAVDALNP
jgi:peroxiredoxin